ncbi:DUF1566 domain-containing protein [Draconibacterium sp.]|nr:DUF1566 domain-containing protein [Draconibacterium sp.]
MKYLVTFLVFATFVAKLWAQSPDQMSYQAIIRDADNHLVQDANVTMQISILEGSVSGTAAYTETHDATTNSNGLVTVQIGTGTTTQDFSAIDWAAGTFFIKTETDPAGGTDYTIISTSQLLSVPYALHARTADSISGDFAAADITAADIESLSNLTGINSGDQSISRTGLIVTLTNGGNYKDSVNTQTLADVIIEGNLAGGQIKNVTDPTEAQDAATKAYVDALEGRITALESRISALEPPAEGDYREGGVVFYIFQEGDAGYVSGEYHGLICATTDQSNAVWGCSGTEIGNTETAIGSGAQNTIEIETNCTTAGTSADICANLTLNNEDDWYLPSKDELNKMYENKTTIDNTAALNGGTAFHITEYYWSSSESNGTQAWVQVIGSGEQFQIPKTLTGKVRAIRTF